DIASGHHRNLLAKSKRFLPPTEPPPSANDYDVSPDGKELCFVSDSAKDYGLDFNSDLYTLDLEREAQPKNITQENEAGDTNPVYSPDGAHVAYARQTIKHFSGDRQRLLVREWKSGMTRELASALGRSCQNPKWPDSRRLAFESENGGTHGIYF